MDRYKNKIYIMLDGSRIPKNSIKFELKFTYMEEK